MLVMVLYNFCLILFLLISLCGRVLGLVLFRERENLLWLLKKKKFKWYVMNKSDNNIRSIREVF